MSLAEANKNLKYDIRLTERNLTVGEINQDDLKKHLSNLPDLAHNVETFTMDSKKEVVSSEDAH